jgi:hypothetical protein
MKSGISVALMFGAAALLHAADAPREFVEVMHSEHVDFPVGGTLRMLHSTGDLTIEGWDRSDVEITTSKMIADDPSERAKATHDLDAHHLVVKREGNGLVVAANSAWYTNLHLEYTIKAPYSAHLVVNHRSGDVYVDGLLGDIDVFLREGEVVLHLPENEKYSIHARCDIGNVYSDYQGEEKQLWWLIGHRIEGGNAPSAPHKLNLRVRVGDIVILKASGNKPAEPPVPVKANGL